jgi:hypothetical protein
MSSMPDEIVAAYGADTLRMYEMFVGDFEKAAPWSSNSIKGCKRFLTGCGTCPRPFAVIPPMCLKALCTSSSKRSAKT